MVPFNFRFNIFQEAMHAMFGILDLRSAILAVDAAPAGAATQQGMSPGMLQMVMLGCIFAAMYFFMIAPQRKKQKAHEAMLSALRSGDEVVTTGGIFGTVTNVKEDRFVIKIADNTKIEVGKGFISSVVSRSDESDK
ncbi:MAG TPA: preprotein translocase subunit YajC [Opitutaceae bacterium]|jgi:preprotein translocase subunit YajC